MWYKVTQQYIQVNGAFSTRRAMQPRFNGALFQEKESIEDAVECALRLAISEMTSVWNITVQLLFDFASHLLPVFLKQISVSLKLRMLL